jgi:two-component system, sensor histidine kinase and response regulator
MENLFQINFEKGHVLAVEDSLVQAKKIKYFFDQNNMPSVICSNGKEALESAKENKPVLIISDIMMPVMDGYELCKNIKQDPELFDIPFILLTSLGDPLDIIKGLQAGADNFITKPYDSDYLLSRINYLIANRHVRKMGSSDMSIEIIFQNQKFQINSEKKQILDLLLSVYEAAVNKNMHLIEAQRQLEKMNESLNLANKELEAFSQTVSHDLKSPLNGVIGFADLLKIEYEDLLDSDGQSYLDYIIKSGRNMAQLIEDLLAFSQSGRTELVPEKINLSEMAATICKDLRAINYVARYDVKIDEGITVFADPKMMAVVLNNLIGNALKYSQKQSAPSVHIGSFESNGKKVIFVRDNGAGFDMQKADTLFRPFIRLHSNQEFQGTGVGLSTVKRVVERHGGAIWFESEPNKGATFYFTID